MDELSKAELRRWHAFKRATQAVNAAVERDIAAATGLSGADFGVLDRLRLGQSSQTELGESLGWSRSRVSHQLSRMERRGLLKRHQEQAGTVRLELTSAGKKAIAAALPVHARAVRRHLLEKLEKSEVRALDRRAEASER